MDAVDARDLLRLNVCAEETKPSCAEVLEEHVAAARDLWGTERGDRAFAEVVELLYEFAIAFAWTMVPEPEAAEEITSRAFKNAWRGLQAYSAAKPFEAWLKAILRNEAHSYVRKVGQLRRKEAHRVSFVSVEDPECDLRSRPDDVGLRVDIERLRASMPARLQDVYRLRFEEGRAAEEVAELLGMSRRSVYNRVCEIRSWFEPLR
jgi:RNA polymerase sigma factor (sigma-70 family)